VAARSDVRDPTDIPIAWMLKIPLDLLEPSSSRRTIRDGRAARRRPKRRARAGARPQKKEEKPGAARH
jgi:hypothetical protein